MLTEKEIEAAREHHDRMQNDDVYRKMHPQGSFFRGFDNSVLTGDNFEGRIAEKREKDLLGAVDSIFGRKKGGKKKRK